MKKVLLQSLKKKIILSFNKYIHFVYFIDYFHYKYSLKYRLNLIKKFKPQSGFEPETSCLQGKRSNQLSYNGKLFF